MYVCLITVTARTSIKVQDSAASESDHLETFEDERTFERADKRAALPRIPSRIVDLDQSQSIGPDDWYCDARIRKWVMLLGM
jgi:hypothetical protein